MIGRAIAGCRRKLRLAQYRRLAENGDEIMLQNDLIDGGCTENVLREIRFRGGPRFKVRDGHTAAHTFREIFLEGHYATQILRKASVVVDVGANIGLFTYYVHQSSPGATIHAFEADQRTYSLLSENTAQLPGQRIKAFPLAIGGREQAVSFYSSPISGWSSLYRSLGAANGTETVVDMIRLSKYIRDSRIEKVDVLKIDVEGNEYQILLGDRDLLSCSIGILIVEVDRNPRDCAHSYSELIARLRLRFDVVIERKSSEFPVLLCY